jgi:hypothetical protein
MGCRAGPGFNVHLNLYTAGKMPAAAARRRASFNLKFSDHHDPPSHDRRPPSLSAAARPAGGPAAVGPGLACMPAFGALAMPRRS